MSDDDVLDDTLLYFGQCQSLKDCDRRILKKLQSTISSAKKSQLMKLYALYSEDCSPDLDSETLQSAVSSDLGQLYQQITAQLIMVVTNGTRQLIKNPKAYMSKLVGFFEKFPEHAGVFATVTLPGVFFYYLTTEFVDVGIKFLEAAMNQSRKRPTMLMFASFFDAFPLFTDVLWTEFDNCVKTHSVLHSISYALKKAFICLTPSHMGLMKKALEMDSQFAMDFFYGLYLTSHCRYRHSLASLSLQDAYSELSLTLTYACETPESPIAEKLKRELESAVALHPRPLSYALDLLFPTVYVVLSCAELKIMFDLLIECEIIKPIVVQSLPKFPPNVNKKFQPGYVQYSPQDFISKIKKEHTPLIYPKRPKIALDGSDEFSRAWEQIDIVSREDGQTTREFLTKPKSPYGAHLIKTIPVLKSPEFLKYVDKVINNKIIEQREDFEKFNEWIACESELIRYQTVFDDEYTFFVTGMVRDVIKATLTTTESISTIEADNIENEATAFISDMYISRVDSRESIDRSRSQSQTFSSTSLNDLLDNPIFTSDMFLTEYLRYIMNLWPTNVGYLPIMTSEYDVFAEKYRARMYGTSRMKLYTENRFIMQCIRDISNLTDRQLGDRFIGLNRILTSLLQFSNTVDKKELLQSGSRKRYVANMAIDLIILSGLPDSIVIFAWYGFISSYMPIMSAPESLFSSSPPYMKYITSFGPKLTKLWAVMLAAMLYILRNENKKLWKMLLAASEGIPDFDAPQSQK